MAQAVAHHAGTRDEAAGRLPTLMLAALGVVYGDIGTSPLYTMREVFEHGGLEISRQSVFGALSLVFWALIIVVTVKYVVLIMRADNRGEGGVLALSALAQRVAPTPERRRLASFLCIIGAALFFGDSVITPAISVLSAVEGLKVATPVFEPYVVPLAVAILAGLFVVQRNGTERVGRLFGPVMLLWFGVLGLLGLLEIADAPEVLGALNPLYAASFFTTHGWHSFVALGSVVLAVTGAEALYADMGHFGPRPIRLSWFSLVLPGLLLNYLGQGALLIRDPASVENPFYLLAPGWALYPMVALATAATVIASQAVISGAFSLTRQAVQLGYLPRLEVRHTSATEIGQVYVPKVNWLLMAAVVAVVLAFESSSSLASAYGIAVTGAMAIDAVLAFFVARTRWRWSAPLALAVFGLLLLVDLAFFGANVLKIPSGGWFPLVLGALIFGLMRTWRLGRRALLERLTNNAPTCEQFAAQIAKRPPRRVPGIAVFLTARAEVIPRSLLHNLKHNHVLHDCVVVATVIPEEVPYIPDAERVAVEHLPGNFHRAQIRFGFMDDPDVPAALARARLIGTDADTAMRTTYFLSREVLVASPRPDLGPWSEQVFIALSNMATSAAAFFRLPPDRVLEVGTQVEI
jgi:KUP system potassium uptake protein